MVRQRLFIYGFIHFALMLSMTIWASFQNSILNAGPLFDKPWFLATLTDTYLSFVVIYLWSAVITKSWVQRILWFVLFMGLGNIAIGLFIMIRAYGLSPKATVKEFLVS